MNYKRSDEAEEEEDGRTEEKGAGIERIGEGRWR